jgi:hypothetical protein
MPKILVQNRAALSYTGFFVFSPSVLNATDGRPQAHNQLREKVVIGDRQGKMDSVNEKCVIHGGKNVPQQPLAWDPSRVMVLSCRRILLCRS